MELLILFGFGNRLLIVILIIVIISGSFAGLHIASIVEYQILAFGLCICGKFCLVFFIILFNYVAAFGGTVWTQY